MSAERVKAECRPIATDLQTRTGVSGCYNTMDIYEYANLHGKSHKQGKPNELQCCNTPSSGSSEWIKFISTELMRESIKGNEFRAWNPK